MQYQKQVSQRLSKLNVSKAISAGPRPSAIAQIGQTKSKTKPTKSQDRYEPELWDDEPNMSDTGLLVTVEDLINLAFGPQDTNKVNFKMIQTIINMIANQLRMLNKRVQLNTEMMDKRNTISSAAVKDTERPPSAKKKTEKKKSSTKAKEDDGVSKSAHTISSEILVEKEYDFETESDKMDKKESVLEAKKSVADAKKDIQRMDKKESVLEAKKSVADAKKDIQRNKKESVLEAKKSVADAKKDIQRMDKKEFVLEAKKSVADARKDIQKMEKKQSVLEAKKSETDSKKEEAAKLKKSKDKKEVPAKSSQGEGLQKTESLLREIGGIEVVPMSRFKQLEVIIEDLKNRITAPPPPMPKMPDNQKLRDDLEKGTTSLSDTMTALALAARVQAAENAISHLSILITKLASEGTLHDEPEKLEKSPEDVKIVKEMRTYKEEGKEREVVVYVKDKSGFSDKFIQVNMDDFGKESGKDATLGTQATATRRHLEAIKSGYGLKSTKSAQSAYSLMGGVKSFVSGGKSNKVTYEEMNEKLRELGDYLLKKLNDVTGFATSAAENALLMVTALSNKMEIALGLDSRITLITTIVHDYVQEMRGLDASKDVQMANFQEQLNQMFNELRAGMELLEKYDKNAQNTAIIELNEFYELLVQELDETIDRHQKSLLFQEHLSQEIQSLVESIEGLRAQKADRDEVADGLKDKADISRLRGLLKEKIFLTGQMNLESRLLICHEKFRKQEETWLLVIKDFTELTKLKADIQHVFEAKEAMQEGLQDVYKKLQLLARVLGDPKAAVITRKMEMSASCGACKTPARLDTGDHTVDLAVKLPSLGKNNVRVMSQADRDQEAMWELLDFPADRKHVCHRWAGGSHTIMQPSVPAQRAPQRFPSAPPMEAYMALGRDGKPYKCSRRADPCLCNTPVEAPTVKSQW